jgi:hypothetical protein
MKLPHKKSRLQRFTSTINPFNRRRRSKFGSSSSSPIGGSQDQAVKAALIGGGLAGLTAASAGISALRRTTQTKSKS